MLELMELLHKVDEQGIDDKLNEKPMAIEKHQGHYVAQRRDTFNLQTKFDEDDFVLDSADVEVREELDKYKDQTLLNLKKSISMKMIQRQD